MTGYGEARHQGDALSLSIELRALNNRYLKVSVRAPEPYNLLEAEFEKIIRKSVKRGTIQVHLRIDKQSSPQDYRINTVALTSYLQQLRRGGHPPGDAPRSVSRDHEGKGWRGTQARVSRAGDVPRDQHHRLKGQRRRHLQGRGVDQAYARAGARVDPECRMTKSE